jgi:hypothetical protein
MMHPNLRLHAGFLYFLDTECEIGPGREGADYILHWRFNECMKKSGLFTAAVTIETFRKMLAYAGFIQAKDWDEYWGGIEPRDPDAVRPAFPKFW